MAGPNLTPRWRALSEATLATPLGQGAQVHPPGREGEGWIHEVIATQRTYDTCDNYRWPQSDTKMESPFRSHLSHPHSDGPPGPSAWEGRGGVVQNGLQIHEVIAMQHTYGTWDNKVTSNMRLLTRRARGGGGLLWPDLCTLI